MDRLLAFTPVLENAGDFGLFCSIGTLVIGPVIHPLPVLSSIVRGEQAAGRGKQALPRSHAFSRSAGMV